MPKKLEKIQEKIINNLDGQIENKDEIIACLKRIIKIQDGLIEILRSQKKPGI
jgi:hypothetical protein